MPDITLSVSIHGVPMTGIYSDGPGFFSFMNNVRLCMTIM